MRELIVPPARSASVMVQGCVSGCVTRESVTVGVTSCAEYSSTTPPSVTPHPASIQSATMPLMVSIHVHVHTSDFSLKGRLKGTPLTTQMFQPGAFFGNVAAGLIVKDSQ